MWKLLKFIPIILKYMINVVPLLYEAVKLGIMVVKEVKPKSTKAIPDKDKVLTQEKIDPG